MSNNSEFKVGIVALGGISSAHGDAVKRSGAGIKITAACDIRPEAVKNWIDTYGGTGYTDYIEMVKKEKLDAVLLATWPNQHTEQIEKLLAAGVKNILCEKALTLTSPDAMKIFDMIEKAGAFLMEGFMYRHNPATRKLEAILATGNLGAVDNVRACFSAFDPELEDPNNPNRNWRQRKECGGGIPYDFACYCVNCCGHFAGGLPKRVYCSGGIGNYGTINRMHGMIEYENGVVGIIESSKKTSFTQEVQISCNQGILNLPIAWTIDRDMTITQRHAGWNNTKYDTFITDGVANWVTSYQMQAENFVAVVRGQAKPVIPLAQSVVNSFALEAMVASIQEKRVVDINIPKKIADAYKATVKPIVGN